MQIAADSREDYFEAAGERGLELRRLDAFITEHAPHLEPTLSGGMTGGAMLGYGEQPYRTRSMKEAGVWPVVALAAQRRYLSLYICAVVDGEYVAERYAGRLGNVSCGKSCIRLKRRLSDLDLDVLGEILEDLDRRFVAGEKLYGI